MPERPGIAPRSGPGRCSGVCSVPFQSVVDNAKFSYYTHIVLFPMPE